MTGGQIGIIILGAIGLLLVLTAWLRDKPAEPEWRDIDEAIAALRTAVEAIERTTGKWKRERGER